MLVKTSIQIEIKLQSFYDQPSIKLDVLSYFDHSDLEKIKILTFFKPEKLEPSRASSTGPQADQGMNVHFYFSLLMTVRDLPKHNTAQRQPL